MDALSTPRLVLRRWRDADREPFAAMNADPEVMEHFPAPLSRAESDELVDSIEAGFEHHGFGLWAVEVRESGEFVGFTGLAVPSFEAHFTPAVEVGWRLARPAWGRGYATEAARAAADYAFRTLRWSHLIHLILPGNDRSIRVAGRLGARPAGTDIVRGVTQLVYRLESWA